MSIFSVAGLQLELASADNVPLLVSEISAAKRRFPWLDMIVLPELAGHGPRTGKAIRLPGPVEARFRELAADLRIWLIPGTFYERRRGAIFNTAPVIDPKGRVVARYRKIFPWYPYERGVAPGSSLVVVDIPGLTRIGVSICYDGWFPEISRSLAWLGAEVILHPTLTSTLDRDVELAIARTNAASNQCYFVDINCAGPMGAGRSIACGPGGEVIHQAGTSREVITLRLDLDHLREVRKNGWQGLGQPLKSFRDNDARFPCYQPGLRKSPALDRLGALRLPGARTPRRRR